VLPLFLLFGARLIDGVSGGTAATAGAVLADITPPEKRARAFGLIGVAFGLGFIIGPFLGGQLARIAVTVPIWVATGFAILNLVVVLTLLPETHPVSERRVLPRKRELNPFAQIARVIGNPAVGRLALSFFLFFLAFNGFTAILVLYFKQRFNWGPELATTAFLIVGVVATVVQGGLIGPLVNRFGEWKLTLIGLGLVIAGCLLIPTTILSKPGQECSQRWRFWPAARVSQPQAFAASCLDVSAMKGKGPLLVACKHCRVLAVFWAHR
jgi:MFS family permease